MIELIDKNVPTDFLIKAVSWVIGEIGSSFYAKDPDKLSELFEKTRKWLELDCAQQSTKKWVVDAIMKLASASEFKNHGDVKLILERYSRHGDL